MECVDGVTKPPAGGTHYNGLCPSSAADQEISSKDLSPRGDDETVSIADRETVAKATENVRQLYAGGLPSYNDPIWDILAPWALTPFLIKHGIAAIKGDDARQLSESLASDDETASIVDRETVAKALENVRKFLLEHAIKGDDAKELSESLASVGKGTSHETDRRLNVVGRFWQSVGDSWTCMAEVFDAFLRSKCPGNKRRMSEEQSTQSIHI
jgi:hypothetical protein